MKWINVYIFVWKKTHQSMFCIVNVKLYELKLPHSISEACIVYLYHLLASTYSVSRLLIEYPHADAICDTRQLFLSVVAG